MKQWFTGFCLCISIIFPQSFDSYFDLLAQGHLQEVRDQLPELRSKYPYEPAISYLHILLNSDGAEMKIGEYLYARGLYSQASQQLKKIPIKYTNSEHFQRAVDLMVSSFSATGEMDSAKFYVSRAKAVRDDLNVGHYGFKVGHSQVGYKKLTTKNEGNFNTRSSFH